MGRKTGAERSEGRRQPRVEPRADPIFRVVSRENSSFLILSWIKEDAISLMATTSLHRKGESWVLSFTRAASLVKTGPDFAARTSGRYCGHRSAEAHFRCRFRKRPAEFKPPVVQAKCPRESFYFSCSCSLAFLMKNLE